QSGVRTAPGGRRSRISFSSVTPKPTGWRWTTLLRCCAERYHRSASPTECGRSSWRRRRGARTPRVARWRSAAALDPGVGWIVADAPAPHRPGHHVEIIEIVAVRRAHGMVPARHQHDISVLHTDRLIDAAVIGVDALEREALRRVETVVVRLLELSLRRRHIGVVLVRRVARPVSSRGDDLHDEQPLGRLGLRQHVAYEAPVASLAADLLRHALAGDDPRLACSGARRAAQRDLAIAPSLNVDGRAGRRIHCARRGILEHRLAAAEG